MAEEKLTQDLELPPGVVVTPGHVVQESRRARIQSDRRLSSDGSIINPEDAEFGSTFPDDALPGASKAPSARSAPDRKVSTPDAAA